MMRTKSISAAILAVFLIIATAGCADSASDAPERALFDRTQVERVRGTLKDLQSASEAGGGSRATSTVGAEKSRAVIRAQVERASLDVEEQSFPVEYPGAPDKEPTVGKNLIVEIPGRSSDVLMFGAHYDSVAFGPGINDNGSGVAALLEALQVLSKSAPDLTLRFAFWDAEEEGVQGSTHYFSSLDSLSKKRVKAYLNYDMVGTDGGDTTILDGTLTSLEGLPDDAVESLTSTLKIHPESARAKQLLLDFYAAYPPHGTPAKEDALSITATDTRQLALDGSIPFSGIANLKQRMKGDELEFAPCYHQACDTLDNISEATVMQAVRSVIYAAVRAPRIGLTGD